MSSETGKTAKQSAAKKPAAVKPPAQTADAELLADQAAEEEAAALSNAERIVAEQNAERAAAEVTATNERAAAEQAGKQADADLAEARKAAELAGRASLLRRLYVARHGYEFGGTDKTLLEHEDDLLAAPAAPASEEMSTASVAQLMAEQSQGFLTALETIVEKIGANQQREVSVALGGSAEDLIAQLAGTVSDGGDGEEPLEEAVVFTSRGANFRAVRKPRHRSQTPNGEQVFTSGITYDFSPNGQFTTRNKDAVAWLKQRPGYNVEYFELGNEPHSAPDPKLVMDKVLEAVLALDDAKLEELETLEKASHKRKVVLDAIASARNKVQAFAAQATV